jgi:hypothetical protein
LLKSNWYELQMQYSFIERLLPTKEVERVPLLMDIVINRPSTKIALLRAALEAPTSDWVGVDVTFNVSNVFITANMRKV